MHKAQGFLFSMFPVFEGKSASVHLQANQNNHSFKNIDIQTINTSCDFCMFGIHEFYELKK